DLAQLVMPGHERFQLLTALQVQTIHLVFSDDEKQGQVQRVDAFAENGPLPTALAEQALVPLPRLPEEGVSVLKIIAENDPAERLAGRERLAVAGINVANLALRHRDQGHLVNPELPAPKPKMKTPAQQVRLVARLAVQGNDPAFRDRAPPRPEFFDDANPAVGDVAHAHYFTKE